MNILLTVCYLKDETASYCIYRRCGGLSDEVEFIFCINGVLRIYMYIYRDFIYVLFEQMEIFRCLESVKVISKDGLSNIIYCYTVKNTLKFNRNGMSLLCVLRTF